jgi:hypothetical protein
MCCAREIFLSQSTQQVADSSQMKFSCISISELELYRLGVVLTVIFLRIFFKIGYQPSSTFHTLKKIRLEDMNLFKKVSKFF